MPYCVADRDPGTAGILIGCHHLLGDGAESVVRVDDQRGQQVVAAREVPVERRRDHAQFAGDRAQGEPFGAVRGELAAGGVLDLLGQFGPGPVPGGASGVHVSQSATSTALKREHCS